jgi:long-chain fatty acid transport protein
MQNGIGARNKALAGAGVANGTDATAAALNPASLTNVGNQITTSTSFFNLRGGFSSVGAGGFTADGAHTSERDLAIIPNLAGNWRVNWGFADAVALTVYGNGGVMTQYGNMVSPTCTALGGAGAFCRGPMGVSMNQTFISLALAKQIAPGFSIGIAPILARTTMKVDGLTIFSAASSDPSRFTNRGTDEAWGTGVRGGIEWKAAPGVKVGVAGNTRVYMDPLEQYRGLFAERGRIDAPASIQAGIAVDVRPNVTLMADYKHIWNSSVAALGNTSTTTGVVAFGVDNGPGFGLRDLDIFKIAMEWRATQLMTLRAGYSYNTAPFKSKDADLSVMHLGVVQHHITGGVKLAVTPRMDVELSGMYAPRMTLSGPELMNPAPGRIMTTEAEQFEVTVGAVYRFGEEPRRYAPMK